MSVIDPLSCGFVKVAAYSVLSQRYNVKKSPDESKKDCKSRLLQVQFQKYNEYFQIDQYTDLGVTYKQFVNNFPKIICTIKNINKRNNSLKTELLDVFSLQNWSSLNEDKKLQHSLTNCQGCFKNTKTS